MKSKPVNPLKSILHPYIFVLKEGGKIKKDFLDYSLMMLYLHSTETIRSPLVNIDVNKALRKKLNAKRQRLDATK